MSRLTGVPALLRLALRRERIRIPVYLLLFGILVVDTAAAPGVDGNDTVVLDAADNNHLNTNLSFATGAGTDTTTAAARGS